MPFTEAQQWALVIMPKITGMVSMVFSGLVIYTVCACKKKRSKTYHRLLLGISLVDVSSSFWLGLSTWPIPEETGIKWASGNTITCNVQGVFTQFGVASSFYNASLLIFYLLVIRYGWKEDAMVKLEPWLHSFPVLWGFGTAIAGVPLTLFNSANLWCWVAPYKDRGAHADLCRWVFFYGPLWIMILVVTINVLLIFQHVRALEKVTERYQNFGEIQYTEDLGLGEEPEQESESGNRYQQCNPSDGSSRDDDDDDGERNQQGGEHRETSADGGGILEEKMGEVGREREARYSALESPLHFSVKDGPENQARSGITNQRPTRNPLRSSLPRSFKFKSTGLQDPCPQQGASQKKRNGRPFSSSMRLFTSFRESDRMRDLRRATKRKKRSRAVANQCLRFAGSFYFTWIALTLTRLLQAINGKTYFPLLIIAATTTPLQGLPNFLVYLYPRFQKAREENPGAGAWSWLKGSIVPETQRNGRSRVSLHTSNNG